MEIIAGRYAEKGVSLFTREWIEIEILWGCLDALDSLPLYEGVD